MRENNFVLAQTKVTAGTDLTASTDSSDLQAPLIYRIKDVKKAELNGHVGHRVQIEGTFDKIGRAKNALSYASDLVELKGTRSRCSPRPASNARRTAAREPRRRSP